MIEWLYEFEPPDGTGPILIVGTQSCSLRQVRGVTLCTLQAWPERACLKNAAPLEFPNWETMIATLAAMFCDGDQKAVSDRLVLKFDHRPRAYGP